MSDQGTPLFLEHRNYRRRRMLDAVRLLPFVGVILFLAPALMPRVTEMSLSGRVIYLFVAWSGLILAIALTTRTITGAEAEPRSPGAPGGAGGTGARGTGDTPAMPSPPPDGGSPGR